MVTITDSAKEKLLALLAKEDGDMKFVRVGVNSGGCSGLTYELGFDKIQNNDDEIIDTWDPNLIEENVLWNSRNEANDPQLVENNDLLDDLNDDSVIPEGWTTQQFIWWLDGPLPEGWTEEQWNKFREENEYLRSRLTD